MSVPSSALPPAAVPTMLETKHRFAYRIRVENLSRQKVDNNDENKDGIYASETEENNHVQLLGRHWNVQELDDDEISLAAAFGGSMNIDEADGDANTDLFDREPVIVDAPSTGAGKHVVEFSTLAN